MSTPRIVRNRRRGWGRGVKKPQPPKEYTDPHGLAAQAERHLDWLEVRHFSPYTVEHRRHLLDDFVVWCEERGISRPEELSPLVIDLYQRHVARLLKHDGSPLSVRAQQAKLTAVSVLGKWLARQRLVLVNPAADIEMPKDGVHLPHATLTLEEVETILAVPDVTTPLGLRDRAILEAFYSTGIRRAELANLRLVDLNLAQGILAVRQGKGRKDRFVPIGERALAWVAAYLRDARPLLSLRDDEGALFLSSDGVALSPGAISTLVRHILERTDIGKPGACHLFRHTMATLMLEGGADLTSIQHILGHRARRPPRSTPRCRSASSRRSTPRPIPARTSSAPATGQKATTPTSSSRRSPASCTPASPILRLDGCHAACTLRGRRRASLRLCDVDQHSNLDKPAKDERRVGVLALRPASPSSARCARRPSLARCARLSPPAPPAPRSVGPGRKGSDGATCGSRVARHVR